MLKAIDLGRRFEARWVLRHVGFELDPGQVVVVRGKNGSGKSTLLRLLAGLLSPNEGLVERPRGELRRVLGYSGLDLAVYPSMSCAEHLEFAARMRGLAFAGAETLLTRVGLGEAVTKMGAQLSTGMRARLKLAMAIQAEPLVLILDEPTASLDDDGRALIADVLAEQRTRGVAVVATNDVTDVALGSHELVLDG